MDFVLINTLEGILNNVFIYYNVVYSVIISYIAFAINWLDNYLTS